MKKLIIASTLIALSGLTLVQTTAAPAAPATPTVDKREAKQQERIANGAASGQLTAKETQHLEKQQAHIDATEAKDKADGKVTRKERRQLARKQDRASKDIAVAKHNDKTAN